MRNLIIYISLFCAISMAFSSCLEAGLEELPSFEEADINNFRFEYRWINAEGNYPQLNVEGIDTKLSIDVEAGTIACVLTVPAANQDFPEAIRNQVSLTSLAGFADISTAATIRPIEGSPKLGEIADFSAGPYQYEITAANGSKKIWTLEISSFTK